MVVASFAPGGRSSYALSVLEGNLGGGSVKMASSMVLRRADTAEGVVSVAVTVVVDVVVVSHLRRKSSLPNPPPLLRHEAQLTSWRKMQGVPLVLSLGAAPAGFTGLVGRVHVAVGPRGALRAPRVLRPVTQRHHAVPRRTHAAAQR